MAILQSILRKPAVKVDPSAPEWLCADQPIENAFTIDNAGRIHKFFFVCGCSKSGTHWVENLLNLHPDVNIKGEYHFEHLVGGFDAMLKRDFYMGSSPAVKPVAIETLHATVRRMLFAGSRDKPSATWIGDRSPRQLSQILPGSPIINIRRDGRDVMVSWNFHHMRAKRGEIFRSGVRDRALELGEDFRANPEKYLQPGTGLLADESWFRAQARVWAGMIDAEFHQSAALREQGTPVLQLIYERMHADVLAAQQQLCEFLALDASQAARPSAETRTLPGFEQENPTGLYRKGAVGDWRNYFTDQQKVWFKQEAGAALIQAGYETDDSW